MFVLQSQISRTLAEILGATKVVNTTFFWKFNFLLLMLMMLVGAVKKSSKSDRESVQAPGAELLRVVL